MSIEISGLDIAIRRMQTIEKQFASLSDVTNSSSGFQSILDAKLNKTNDNNSQSKVFKNEFVDKAEIDGLIEKYSNKNGLDKDFVKALVKQESGFNPNATSKCGAMGLMQLMPDSARLMAQRLKLDWDKKKLTEPEYNLALGQNYLQSLMNDKQIQGNLLFTAVAYNSGPGNLYKLKKKMKYNDDPLLFIESSPFRETRAFVERIMANYWIYRTLMNQDVLSLDNLIEGCWPVYVGQDNQASCQKN